LSEIDAEAIRRAYVHLYDLVPIEFELITSTDTRCIPSPLSKWRCHSGLPIS
jgi:hypothetical protein